MKLRIAAAAAVALALPGLAAPALAAGDASHGEQIFHKCKICHATEKGVNRVGPSLFDVVGRPIASEKGFHYSSALKKFADGKTWTPDLLDKWIDNPRKLVPGTRMSFAGIHSASDRADVIAYLETLK